MDGTPFTGMEEYEIMDLLKKNGFETSGREALYNGITGERIEAEVFIGVAFYQKLHHMQ